MRLQPGLSVGLQGKGLYPNDAQHAKGQHHDGDEHLHQRETTGRTAT